MRLLAPGLGALVAACSAGVDDYRILDDGIGGGSGGASAAGGKGNDQSGGRSSGGQGSGGTRPDASAGGTTNSGGSGNTPSSGGNETGGRAGDGGASTGGTSTGGTSTGGTSTGGTSTGGPSTGGASTGGTGGAATFGKPAVVGQTMQPSGITAGAWDGTYFWVLNPTARTFYRINPANTPATVTGPYNLPGTTLAPRVFGASATHVYIIADAKAYRVPNAGSATGTGVTFGTTGEMTQLLGAYASGYLLVGRVDAQVAARWFDGTTMGTVTALANAGRIASDGISFAVARMNATAAEIHRVTPGTWATTPPPCNRGSFQTVDQPLSIFYTAVAWVFPGSGARPRLTVSRIANDLCSSVGQNSFGVSGTSGHPIGLLDETHVVVLETFNGGVATVTVKDMVTFDTTAETSINLGGATPRDIIVGGRYALVIGDNLPVLVTF
jgi:hypothetical protein